MDKETDIMDFYTSDSKLSDLIETDFHDILNHDDITPPHNSVSNSVTQFFGCLQKIVITDH